MKRTLKQLFATFAVAVVLALPLLAQAENPLVTGKTYTGQITQEATGSDAQDLPVMVGKIINIALSFLGIILLIYILMAGFIWMTAGDSKDKPETAKKMIKNAIIGLVIVIAAFAISNFVVDKLSTVAGG